MHVCTLEIRTMLNLYNMTAVCVCVCGGGGGGGGGGGVVMVVVTHQVYFRRWWVV